MLETEIVILVIRDLLSASHQGTADHVHVCPIKTWKERTRLHMSITR